MITDRTIGFNTKHTTNFIYSYELSNYTNLEELKDSISPNSSEN